MYRAISGVSPANPPKIAHRAPGAALAAETIRRRISVQLLAGRFLEIDDRCVDLATNEDVQLRFEPPAETREPRAARAPSAGSLEPSREQTDWLRRCATLFVLRHPHLAPLVDYGVVGHLRFEARGAGLPRRLWRARDAASAAALQSVVEFLHACGVSAGRLVWDRVVEVHGRPVLEIDALTGTSFGEAPEPALAEERGTLWRMVRPDPNGTWGGVVPGIRLQPRTVLGPLVEVLECDGHAGPRRVFLQSPPGAGATTLLTLASREARLRGYVPVCVAALRRLPALGRLLAGRHVMLIDDDDGDRPLRQCLATSATLVSLSIASPHPHVLIRTCRQAPAGHPALAMDPLTPEALVAMLPGWPDSRGDSTARQRAAREARGVPKRFLALMTGDDPQASRPPWTSSPRPASGLLRVAETAAPYVASRPAPRPALVDRPLVQARDVTERAAALAERGLHAMAERLLRQALGVVGRRGEVGSAGRVALALAVLLRDRGRSDEAMRLVERAQSHFANAGEPGGLLDAARLLGACRTDVGRLAEGDAVLRAARMVAEDVGDPQQRVRVDAELARSAYWQWRLEEACRVVSPRSDEGGTPGVVASERLAVRLALARREFCVAGRRASRLLDLFDRLPTRADQCQACLAAADLYATVTDLDGLHRVVEQGLGVARAAHLPLVGVKLRVTCLEGLVRARRGAEAARLARRLMRTRVDQLPPLLRARTQLAIALALPDDTGTAMFQAAARRFAQHSGAAALERRWEEDPPMELVEGLLELLQICQEADDDARALAQVCVRLKDQLRGSSVAIFGRDPHAGPLASAGPRLCDRPRVVERALETGLTIPPSLNGGYPEAAAAIRYAGSITGALVCRWSVDTAFDSARVAALLSAAAGASAPAVRALLDRGARPGVPAAGDDFELLGTSSSMQEVRRAIQRSAAAPFPALIEGESGSGKELVARALHVLGPRRERKFCAVNCAALTDELLEAELFGHARGAFTGAIAERVGLFEAADGGTLFLDEVGELSGRAQAKLLRVLQESEIRRVGESFARRVNVRIIAATNRRLDAEVAAGRFRQDLLYRLNVIRIRVPPLRERLEDVPMLALHFWADHMTRLQSRATLTPETLAALARYDWPGNVRELQNVMAALAVRAPRRGRVGPDHLPEVIAAAASPRNATLEEARRSFERRFVRAALLRAGGHRGRAAAELGLSRQGLAKLLARLQVEPGPAAEGGEFPV
jgi:DNA-binding NtrC family response regulator